MSGSLAKAVTEQILPVLRDDIRSELRTAGLFSEPAPREHRHVDRGTLARF